MHKRPKQFVSLSSASAVVPGNSHVSSNHADVDPRSVSGRSLETPFGIHGSSNSSFARDPSESPTSRGAGLYSTADSGNLDRSASPKSPRSSRRGDHSPKSSSLSPKAKGSSSFGFNISGGEDEYQRTGGRQKLRSSKPLKKERGEEEVLFARVRADESVVSDNSSSNLSPLSGSNVSSIRRNSFKSAPAQLGSLGSDEGHSPVRAPPSPAGRAPPSPAGRQSPAQLIAARKECQSPAQLLASRKECQSPAQFPASRKESQSPAQLLASRKDSQSHEGILPSRKQSQSPTQRLPALVSGARHKAPPGDTGSRDCTPLGSTTEPSSADTSRRSSSLSSRFASHPVPEAATLTSAAQPVPLKERSSSDPLGMKEHRAPTRTSSRASSRGGSRAGSRSASEHSVGRTPDSHGSSHYVPLGGAASSSTSGLREEAALPTCRTGWSDRGSASSEPSPVSSMKGSPAKVRGSTLPRLSKPGDPYGHAGEDDPPSPTTPPSMDGRKRRPRRHHTNPDTSASMQHEGETEGNASSSSAVASAVTASLNVEAGKIMPRKFISAENATAKHGAPAPTLLSTSASSTSTGFHHCATSRSLNVGSKMRHPKQQLRNGSRDDSFLSTISESTRSSDSTDLSADDKRVSMHDGSQIEVFSEIPNEKGRQVAVLKDFAQLFKNEHPQKAEEIQQVMRQYGFDKPLEMQRRVIPLVMSAFREEQKSFITVQGSAQCGNTSGLVLGILGAVRGDVSGIRAVVMSTSSAQDFRKSFDIFSEVHPLKLECFEGANRNVRFEGVPSDPDEAMVGVDPLDDLQRLSSALSDGAPAVVFGHPSRVLPLLRESPSWNIDLSNIQVLALDDAEDIICTGLMDEVCEVCNILRHFSKHRLRHIVLSHFLSHEAKSMIRCLRNSLLRQQNLFGIRAHRTQARAKTVSHYYAVAPRQKWPSMLAALHHALSLPSGIIFDDASAEARAQARLGLRALGVTASVWNALQEQGSGARAAARDGASAAPRGPAFHLMPSDLVVLKVDLPQVRCVLHFEVPRQELSIYGLRLMCLEQNSKTKKGSAPQGPSVSVLFVEEKDVVRELEKTFHIQMQEVPTEMLIA